MKTRKLMLGAVFASVFAVAAWAHGGATGVVKERMDGMGAMKEAVRLLTPMIQGQTGYDPGVIREQAALIAAHAGDALTGLFPEGSLDAPSEAKDTIRQDWEKFAALAEQLRETSQGLAAAADNGLMMSGDGTGGMMGEAPGEIDFAEMPADAAFTMMGQVCSACHSQFRVEE